MIIATDFDGTLSTGEMGRAIGHCLEDFGRGRAYRRFFLKQVPYYFLAKWGIADMRKFRINWGRTMPHLFEGLSEEELNRIFERVVEDELWAKRRQDVIDELMVHHQQGHKIVVVTGAYQPMLEIFARKLGADVLGSPLEFKNNRSTGKVLEPYNVGEAKVHRLETYLAGEKLGMAYSDSGDDLPLLEMAETPVAVYPDPNLRPIAEARGWRILN